MKEHKRSLRDGSEVILGKNADGTTSKLEPFVDVGDGIEVHPSRVQQFWDSHLGKMLKEKNNEDGFITPEIVFFLFVAFCLIIGIVYSIDAVAEVYNNNQELVRSTAEALQTQTAILATETPTPATTPTMTNPEILATVDALLNQLQP